jgi:hypothetical protein
MIRPSGWKGELAYRLCDRSMAANLSFEKKRKKEYQIVDGRYVSGVENVQALNEAACWKSS